MKFSQEFIDNVALAFKGCNKLQTENKAKDERIKELGVALDKYGSHTRGCAYTVGLGCCIIQECDCGFEQALKG